MPEPNPNQVLIKMYASGLCYTDVHITQGRLPTEFPRVIGHEPVGEIVKIGSLAQVCNRGADMQSTW
jgi:D-arabinose 1-dehydrogenase-like Zn-dependent alcohol dehydrogenase